MKEEIIHLSDHLKGLTDGERTILWQAMTTDIVSRMMKRDTDEMLVTLRKGENGQYFAQVDRGDPISETFVPLMGWHGPDSSLCFSRHASFFDIIRPRGQCAVDFFRSGNALRPRARFSKSRWNTVVSCESLR